MDLQYAQGQFAAKCDTAAIRISTTKSEAIALHQRKWFATSRLEESPHPKLRSSTRPKPVVKVSPDQHVFIGETVTLTCDIQTGGNIQWIGYSWIKDGDTHNPHRTTSAAELSFRAVSASVSGQYSCRGERSDSQRSDISDTLTLTVSALPRSRVTVTPDSAVFTEETVNLTCVIESDHSDWTYEWYKDRNSVNLQSDGRYTVNRDTLTIRGAAESDQGQYWCRGQRSGRPNSSQSSSAVSLSVKVKGISKIHFSLLSCFTALPMPTLHARPGNPVFTGEPVNLKCVIESGHSDWTYEWYKNRNSVKIQSSSRQTVNRDTLTIRGAAESDQGQYQCKGQRSGRPNSSQSSSAVSLSVMREFNTIIFLHSTVIEFSTILYILYSDYYY
nr:basement membrane-specific heparan sulfate proteoglycan core protein [Danio rerio]|eukprot:XP_021333783.1 basement membrane-specific heparan sulfate proteoglycan core protein [Danio rerio]